MVTPTGTIKVEEDTPNKSVAFAPQKVVLKQVKKSGSVVNEDVNVEDPTRLIFACDNYPCQFEAQTNDELLDHIASRRCFVSPKTESQDKSMRRLYFNALQCETPENAAKLRLHLDPIKNVELPESLLARFEIKQEDMGFALPPKRTQTKLNKTQFEFLKAQFEQGRADPSAKMDGHKTHELMRRYHVNGRKVFR